MMKFNFSQILKFIIVGASNTLIDFAILNLLMWVFGIYSGKFIVVLNAISFSIAVTNSYFLNKYWTFKSSGGKVAPQFAKFFMISVGGIIINSSLVYFGTTHITPFIRLSPAMWANTVKFVAIAVSLTWNFAGYKVFVFKDHENTRTLEH